MAEQLAADPLGARGLVQEDAGDVVARPVPRPAQHGLDAVVVLPRDVCGLKESARILAWLAGESAGPVGEHRGRSVSQHGTGFQAAL